MNRAVLAGTAVSAVALAAVAGVLFAGSAQASPAGPPGYNLVQVQSYVRSGPTASCDAPPMVLSTWRSGWADPSNPISGPTWHPSYEQWPNGNTGGWTCIRAITWGSFAALDILN